MLELLITVSVMLIVAAIAVPNIIQAMRAVQLRTTAGDLSSLIQQARIMAAKNNATYPIRYTTIGGVQVAYIDVNLSGGYNAGEPAIYFTAHVLPAAGAPTGTGGQPPAYTLAGDTGATYYDNTNTIAFSPRGLPCNYDTSTNPPTCATPSARYFVYYMTQTRPVGPPAWGAVLATKSGRSKVLTWSGASWN